ncbi:hypothetical protein [Microbacterium capsulatum]|uniref:Leucine rich repeat variant domain-containing protein n=1 Tax=Microbacterium capsulatum TaxID=3041921 RepID=A0ABU0XEA1_9MICO|nr:hypothetical protein [Microbacterium sp. ASV81]MDQ4213447.1 hypothetical protein [Microbacterium sp. ASV81]
MDRLGAWTALHDPATAAADLAAIAAQYPEFASAVEVHPNAYPELVGWARHTVAALAAGGARTTPAAPLLEVGETERSAGDDVPSVRPAASEVLAPDPALFAPSFQAVTPDASAGEAMSVAGEPVAEPGAGITPARKWRLSDRRVLWTVGGVLAVLVLIGGGAAIWNAALVPQREKDAAVAAFHDDAAQLDTAAFTLASSAKNAHDLLAAIGDDSVADPSARASLQKLVDEAAKVDVTKPGIAGDTAAIKGQTADLQKRVETIQKLSSGLDDGVSAVKASAQALVDRKIAPSSTYTIEATDGNGNKERITIKIGSWVKGSDAATLDKAWNLVGGKDKMPLSVGSDGFTPADGAFVFGTVQIENLTTAFPAANFSGGSAWVYLTPLIKFDGMFTNWHDPSFEGMGATMQARQYSSGSASDAVGGAHPLIKADMSKGNTWGPVPFVIGLDTVFTPNNPNGNPKLDDIQFSLGSTIVAKVTGDTTFRIGKSW